MSDKSIMFDTTESTLDFSIQVDTASSITLSCANGKELIIDCSGEEVVIRGDAGMSESAEQFFVYVLKPMIDEYLTQHGE